MGKFLLSVFVVAISSSSLWVSGTALAQAPAPATAPAIPVVNIDGYFATASLQSMLGDVLSDATRSHLATSNDAIWVLTLNVALRNGSNYCWSAVGLTEKAPKGRTPRIPQGIFSHMVRSNTRGALDDKQLNECMSGASGGAAKRFASAKLEQQLAGIELTREKGTRAPRPASPKTARLYARGVSDAGKQAIFENIPSEFSAAFDYRRLEWVVLTDVAVFGDQRVCVSTVGVAARAPDERNTRLPGYRRITARELTPEASRLEGAEQRCMDEISLNAVKDGLAESWDDKGLLDKFALTQETGLPLVSNYRAKIGPSAEEAAAAKFRKALKIGSDSHCGLVIEVRGPIAKVQTMIGEVWLKTAQLYPKAAKSCRFVNGVYQDPD